MFHSIDGLEHGVFYISSIKKDETNNTLIFYLMNGGNIKEQYGSADEMNDTFQEFMDKGLFVEIDDKVFNVIHFSSIGKAELGNDYLVNITVRTGEPIIGKFDNEQDRDELYDAIVNTAFGGGGGGTPTQSGGKLIQKPTKDDFPATGDTKCAYVAKDTDKLYYWDATEKEYVDIAGGSGDAVLAEKIVSNVACGAAPVSTTFPKDMTFTEFAKTILVKDVAPTITTSFTGTGTKEVGTTVNGTTMTLNITNNSSYTKAAYTIKEINFYVGNTKVNTQAYSATKATYTHTYSTAITTNTTVKAELVYNTNKTMSGTGTFEFIYAKFYGVIKTTADMSDTLAQSLLSSLTKTLTKNKGFTYSNVTLDDERFCYMYPASYGMLTSIKDGNGFEQIDGYTPTAVTISYPTNNASVSYVVWTLDDPATGTGFTQIYS